MTACTVKVGDLVRVREMGGFGTGRVVELQTEDRFTGGRVIPLRGWVRAIVEFQFGDGEGGAYPHRESFNAKRLSKARLP